jgi:hypothetical protein
MLLNSNRYLQIIGLSELFYLKAKRFINQILGSVTVKYVWIAGNWK